jgi:hypothetical protein
MKQLDLTRLFTFLFLTFLASSTAFAQSSKDKFNLYEQTSETAGLVIGYAQDIRAVRGFYSPMAGGGRGFASPANVLNSPEQRKRLNEIDQNYLKKLAGLDFNAMSIYGKVDYILLKRNIDDHLLTLDRRRKRNTRRLRNTFHLQARFMSWKKAAGAVLHVDGQKVAGKLNDVAAGSESC